jgi:hypothetical protein
MIRVLTALLCLVLLAGSSLAGPNAGGVLVVHYNKAAKVPSEKGYVDGGLKDCKDVVNQAPADSTVMWFVYAAFPPGSSPRLKVVCFGCKYDADKVGLLRAFPPPSALEIKRNNNGTPWPGPGTGDSIAFDGRLTNPVNEIYCFAGYGPKGETFATCSHPDSLLGGMADDGVPSVLDGIVKYGSLGFGVPGSTPCPGKAAPAGPTAPIAPDKPVPPATPGAPTPH